MSVNLIFCPNSAHPHCVCPDKWVKKRALSEVSWALLPLPAAAVCPAAVDVLAAVIVLAAGNLPAVIVLAVGAAVHFLAAVNVPAHCLKEQPYCCQPRGQERVHWCVLGRSVCAA